MLQALDVGILQYLNSFATKSALFDNFYIRVLQMPSVKFLPITVCIVWLWFDSDRSGKQRPALVQALIGGLLALAASRLIQNLSPSRPRPLNMESLDFIPPVPLPPDQVNRWNDWSSFPSDNAALSFALAIGIWRVSRPLGWACLFWAAFVISLPRVYAGFHYPSDIVGGAVLGILSTLACVRFIPKMSILNDMGALERRTQALLYSAGFALLFYITTMFEDIRRIITRLAEIP